MGLPASWAPATPATVHERRRWSSLGELPGDTLEGVEHHGRVQDANVAALATDADLAAHAAGTTSVHGVAAGRDRMRLALSDEVEKRS